jgi:hypothetical protein
LVRTDRRLGFPRGCAGEYTVGATSPCLRIGLRSSLKFSRKLLTPEDELRRVTQKGESQ